MLNHVQTHTLYIVKKKYIEFLEYASKFPLKVFTLESKGIVASVVSSSVFSSHSNATAGKLMKCQNFENCLLPPS